MKKADTVKRNILVTPTKLAFLPPWINFYFTFPFIAKFFCQQTSLEFPSKKEIFLPIICFQTKRIFFYTINRSYAQSGLIFMQRTEMFCDFHPQKNHAKKRLNSTLWLLSKLPIGRAAQGYVGQYLQFNNFQKQKQQLPPLSNYAKRKLVHLPFRNKIKVLALPLTAKEAKQQQQQYQLLPRVWVSS